MAKRIIVNPNLCSEEGIQELREYLNDNAWDWYEEGSEEEQNDSTVIVMSGKGEVVSRSDEGTEGQDRENYTTEES